MRPFQLQPAGVTPASQWVPLETIARQQPVVLVPKLNPTNGEQLSLTESDDATYQAIATEFRTVFGTGVAVTNIGQKLEDIKKNDTSAPDRIRFEVDRILGPYIAQQLIRVEKGGIEIVAGPDAGSRASVTVGFTLLRSGMKRSISQ